MTGLTRAGLAVLGDSRQALADLAKREGAWYRGPARGAVMYGLVDLVVIVVILVIVFGARWLPAAGAAMGRALARRAARREAAARRQPEQGRAGE